MNEVAIQVENLGKLYRIGERQQYQTLREAITNIFVAPLKGLKKRLKPQDNTSKYIWALKGVSFSVKRGEVVGVIGRNGAGKTTLLKILSRITPPTQGRVQIHGCIASLLEVGTGFHPELTGRDNIYLNGAILGMRKQEIKRKFDEIVAFAEVERFIDTPVKHYSSGMYVRLAFAVAAHLEPDILLVDEVLAVGDVLFQRKCLGKMGDITKEGRTVLFVSHNMLAIQAMCKRCVFLQEGRIYCDDKVDDTVDRYLSMGMGDMPSSINTEDWLRPTGMELGEDLRVINVCMRSPDGRARIMSQAPLIVEIQLRVERQVEDVAYGFAVFSLEGICLFRCHNNDNMGKPYPRLEPGRYRIRGIAESIPLPPGHYRLDIGVRCGKKGLDWLRDLMFFEVVESEIVETPWLRAQDGLFREPSRWESPQHIL